MYFDFPFYLKHYRFVIISHFFLMLTKELLH